MINSLSRISIIHLCFASILLLSVGCKTPDPHRGKPVIEQVLSQADRDRFTPDSGLQLLMDGNRHFVSRGWEFREYRYFWEYGICL
ncbi:MAG: hypothetical protein ACJASX_001110 [Limisphaerales bacterium]|jgi:hypothetical protein